jgi:hypothetical protein
VDNSPDMLARVPAAVETVLGEIETINLRSRFGAVILASNLINTTNSGQRQGFLRTCRSHVADAGTVVLQRLDPRWADGAWSALHAGPYSFGPVTATVEDIQHNGAVLSATVRSQANGRTWLQPFENHVLDDEAIAVNLGRAGLGIREWLDADRTWLAAVPVVSPGDAIGSLAYES